MPDQDTDFVAYADLFEEGDVPMVGIRVLAFLDSGGVEQSRMEVEGDASVLFTTGLLEWAKDVVLNEEDDDADS